MKKNTRTYVTLVELVENGNITKTEKRKLEKQGFKDGDFYLAGAGNKKIVMAITERGKGFETAQMLDSVVGRDTGIFRVNEGEKKMKKNQVVLESKENGVKAVGTEKKSFMRYSVVYGARKNEKAFTDFFDASDFILNLRKEQRNTATLIERRADVYREYTAENLDTMRLASLGKCGVTAEDVLYVTNTNNFSRGIACILTMQGTLAEMRWERDKSGYLSVASARTLRRVWKEYVTLEKSDKAVKILAYGKA